MDFYANLHLHSTHSDGVFTPAQLAREAKLEGYRAAALTDHDTISGNIDFAKACEKEGLECIFGAEFSVTDPVEFHFVGFDFDPNYPKMREYLDKMSEKETNQTKVVFEWAVQNGDISGITWDEVMRFNHGITWLCNNHVFNAMKAKGLITQSEYMAWFDKNFRKQRSQVKSDIKLLPADKLIALVHDAGGIVILAHPHDRLQYVEQLTKYGLDGIEVWHPDLPQEERQATLEIALKNNLYISGGSDHSGKCSGYYGSFPDEKALKKNPIYIEPHSVGTTKEYFDELRTKKKNR